MSLASPLTPVAMPLSPVFMNPVLLWPTDVPSSTVTSSSSAPTQGTDTVEVSAEGQIAAGEATDAAAILPYPWPPVPEEGSIAWLLDNLRQREYVQNEMFRLEQEARLDGQIGQVASSGKGPADIRREADALSAKGKLDEAAKLYDLANQMEWRNVPEDDPSTPNNERRDAGARLMSLAKDKRAVASVLGMKLDRMELAFDEAVKKVSLDGNVNPYYPYPILYATAEAVTV